MTALARILAPLNSRFRVFGWHWFSKSAIGHIVLAISVGLVLFLAFPPVNLWWLAPVAVAGFLGVVASQPVIRGGLYGFIFGIAFFIPLLIWTSSDPRVGYGPWLLLSTFEGFYLALLGAALSFLSQWRIPFRRIETLGFVLGSAGLWVAQEALRGRAPWGGFPWGRLAFSQADSPMLGLAALGGAPLISFAVALLGGIIFTVYKTVESLLSSHSFARLSQTNTSWLSFTALLFLIPAISLMGLVVPRSSADGLGVRVAVIQGNVPEAGLEFNARRRVVLDNHVQATLRLASDINAGRVAAVDIVIWPENSSDIDPLVNADAAERISAAARAIKAPILVGAVLDGPREFISNVGLVWSPQSGPRERYVKQHPVPFAEYVPYREFARRISSKVDLIGQDFVAGQTPGVLRMGPVLVGDVICFEVAYDGLVTETVRAGAQLLVVQTNNATFGRSAESEQQLAMVRLRAVEHGLYTVMASTSGVSATITPNGRVLQRSNLFTQAVLTADMRSSTQSTIATRIGYWPEFVSSFSGIAMLLVALSLRLCRSRDITKSGIATDHSAMQTELPLISNNRFQEEQRR